MLAPNEQIAEHNHLQLILQCAVTVVVAPNCKPAVNKYLPATGATNLFVEVLKLLPISNSSTSSVTRVVVPIAIDWLADKYALKAG
mgnify:CR=1 FL=1